VAGPRIAIFTHDTFGLGHVRRCLHFARALAERDASAAILLITGSPALLAFRSLPGNMDVVKIPTVARTGAREYRPPHLPLPLDEVTGMRSRLTSEAVRGFAPDVFLVDNFPLGSRGELLPVLRELKKTGASTVLGLRDILDTPETVRADWQRQEMHAVLEDLYDRILVYGMREILDVASAYGMSPRTAGKLVYCGYVTAPEPEAGPAHAASLGVPGRFLLATGGGGGDGFPLIRTFVQALPLVGSPASLVVTGPLMSTALRREIQREAGAGNGVVVRDFVPGLSGYLGAARVVVSMCGYNTAAEIVAQKARAIVVPRTWRYGEHEKGEAAGVEGEQGMRARALARLGLVTVLDACDLTPGSLAECIREVTGRPAGTPSVEVDLDGVFRVAGELLSLAGGNGNRRP
jgi:predicted glycosyltransferase